MKLKSKTFLYVALLGGILPAVVFADDVLQPYWASATSSAATTHETLTSTEQFPLFNSANQQKQLLALKWQHQPVDGHSLRFSAGYGDDVYLEEMPYDSVSTMAELAWTGQGAGRFRPSLSGSLFVGEADTRDEAYRHLDRKYMGFTVGGRVTLSNTHSPYISFRMLRTSYDEAALDDPLVTSAEISRLTAGWDWQVRPNWRLRAEADFTLEDEFSLNFDRYDPSRVFFSTRFDFR
ncbi:MAG: hypothetical protein ACE5HM_02650 [Acidiferrobacterales bacterium]